jgi:hypothetical protein
MPKAMNSPPPLYQVLMSRARRVAVFADLIESLGWPEWRVDFERELASKLLTCAKEEYLATPRQLKLL